MSTISSTYTMMMIIEVELNRINNDESGWILIKPNPYKELFNF